jgi:hypothetical protein
MPRKSPAKKSAGKSAPKKAAAKKRAPRKATAPSGSIVDRVKRVATGVVEQAQTAVTQGVDAAKELGENIVERVTG